MFDSGDPADREQGDVANSQSVPDSNDAMGKFVGKDTAENCDQDCAAKDDPANPCARRDSPLIDYPEEQQCERRVDSDIHSADSSDVERSGKKGHGPTRPHIKRVTGIRRYQSTHRLSKMIAKIASIKYRAVNRSLNRRQQPFAEPASKIINDRGSIVEIAGSDVSVDEA